MKKCPFLRQDPPLLMMENTEDGGVDITEIIGECLEGECALWLQRRVSEHDGESWKPVDRGHCGLLRGE